MPGYLIHYAVCRGKSLRNRDFVLGVEAPDILKKYYKMYGDRAFAKWDMIICGSSAPTYLDFQLRAQQVELCGLDSGLHYGVSSSPGIREYWNSLYSMQHYRPFYRGYLWHLLTDKLIYAYLDIDSKFSEELKNYNGLDVKNFKEKQREKLHEDWDIINAKVHERYPEIALTPEVKELGVVKYKDKGNLTYVDEKILFTLISYMRTIDPIDCDMDSVIDDIYAMVK